jgi:hypothetical protein
MVISERSRLKRKDIMREHCILLHVIRNLKVN